MAARGRHSSIICIMKNRDTYSTDTRGGLRFTPTDPPRPAGRYVYQRVLAGLGNVQADPTRRLQLRRWVQGTYSNTAAQLQRRAVFRLAAVSWRHLSVTDKAHWKALGKRRRITSYNAYISHALKTN